LPGMLIHIYRKGQLVHTTLSGHIDLERQKPMREDAIFRIYSMSKPITAVALMMLVEEGRLGLDDPVHTYIPEWKDLGVYASGMPSLLADAPASFITTPPLRPMKVIDLATHTSGLTYGFMMRTAVDAAYRQLKLTDRQTPGGVSEMVDQLAKLPLDFSPGTAWNYSVAIDVLGYLVGKLSGMSFGEFLRTRLFEPLGMNDTAFWVSPDKTERFTSCYQPESGGGGPKLQDDARESTYAAPPKLESGGGGRGWRAEGSLRCRRMRSAGAGALFTGGNAGLGQRICHALAKEGAHVAVMYAQSREQAEGVARDLASRYQINAAAFQCDITDGAATERVIGEVCRQFGRLD